MKRLVKTFMTTMLGLMFFSFFGCNSLQDEDEEVSGKTASLSSNQDGKNLYSNFVNYPKGRQNDAGHLKLTNEANTTVLVFTDSVSESNYIGTIPALSSINIALNPGKFYSIVSVTKDAYENDPNLAVRTSVLVYYSDVQAYTVSVSPENMTGSATWIFNNYTSYWASIEKADESGEIYAVIAPNAKRVTIPVQTNKNYDYKVVYKKQLKYNGKIIAVSNKTAITENDTASFMNLTKFQTDLYGDATKDNSDLAPTVKFVNQTGKTLRVFNGQVQLTDTGIHAEDYALPSGISAFFTGFTEGTTLSDLNIQNIAWADTYYCPDSSTILQNGYVYTVVVSKNTYNSNNSSTNKVSLKWTVTRENANKFYTEE